MHTVLNVIRMDLVMVRRRVLLPVWLLLLLVILFSLFLFPAASAFAVLISGMIVYPVYGIDDRDRLSRLYETLPFRRTHLIAGRFAAGLLCILAVAAFAHLLGYTALNARLYLWSENSYFLVTRAQGTGMTVSRTTAVLFAVTCAMTGYLYLMNFIFGRHRELITVLGVFILLLLLFVPNLNEFIAPVLDHLWNMDRTAPVFHLKMYGLGILFMALTCGLAVLLRGRREYK